VQLTKGAGDSREVASTAAKNERQILRGESRRIEQTTKNSNCIPAEPPNWGKTIAELAMRKRNRERYLRSRERLCTSKLLNEMGDLFEMVLKKPNDVAFTI
jgi:hypothetical protein